MQWIILTSEILSVLIVAAGASNITIVGDWSECPVTIITYPGCSVSVHAYFRAFLVPPHEDVDCSDDFAFAVFFNNVKQPDPLITVINNTEDGGNSCLVVGSIVDVPVGDHDVEFRAQLTGTIYETVGLVCDDHLLVEVPHPSINEPIITCDGVLVKWVEHPSVNDSNHGDILYSLVVMATDLSYSTSNTSVLIPYSDGLEYDTLYTVQLSSVYCGNQGNVTNTTLYTAMAPDVIVEDDESMTIRRINSTHGRITFTIKMSRDDCIVSHPKTVTTNMSCTSSLVPERGSGGQGGRTISVTERPVTVRHDGKIVIYTIVPVDNRCATELTFNNGGLSASTDPLDINTNQLRTCIFIPNTHGIVSTCNYLYTSTDLWGCRVELMTSDLTIHNSIDVPVAQEHGFFNDLCNDIYTLRCYGLRYNPHNNDGNGSTQPLMVSYDNSPNHTRAVTVTAGDTSCTTSSSVTTTGTRLSSSSTPTISPSLDPLMTNGDSMTLIVIVLVIVFILIIVVVIIISIILCLIFWKSRVKSSNNVKATEESGTGKGIQSPINGSSEVTVEMRNHALFIPSVMNSESSRSTQQSTAITNTDTQQQINDDSHDEYFTNEARQTVSKDIGDYVSKEANVPSHSTNNSENLLLYQLRD